MTLLSAVVDNVEYRFQSSEWDAILHGDADGPLPVMRYLIKLGPGSIARLIADNAEAEAELSAKQVAAPPADLTGAVAPRAIVLPEVPLPADVSPPANVPAAFEAGKAHDEALPFPGNTTFDRDIRDGFVPPDEAAEFIKPSKPAKR